MSGNEIQKWSDKAMFRSETHEPGAQPIAHLLAASHDPLGQIAAFSSMYTGKVVRDLADVTDEERRYHLREMQKTKLTSPLESVHLHFMYENVTRAFTHQLVRQRTAVYAQESMRFAVVEDMNNAVALPPSLAGTLSWDEWVLKMIGDGIVETSEHLNDEFIERYASRQQQWRFRWEETVETIGDNYNFLINDGMPAEDARGLMPTNIMTRINYDTNLRGLLDHAGNRLCTQAQFEWRTVLSMASKAMRQYGMRVSYIRTVEEGVRREESSEWQWNAIADLLAPVCYATGSCQFQADFDRHCTIRDRVQQNASVNRPSSEWGSSDNVPGKDGKLVFIGAIHPREWLADPAAARTV